MSSFNTYSPYRAQKHYPAHATAAQHTCRPSSQPVDYRKAFLILKPKEKTYHQLVCLLQAILAWEEDIAPKCALAKYRIAKVKSEATFFGLHTIFFLTHISPYLQDRHSLIILNHGKGERHGVAAALRRPAWLCCLLTQLEYYTIIGRYTCCPSTWVEH